MMRQRWGTFSVKDHRNRYAFLPELFLYDRLVIPVPANEEERRAWKKRGWDPDLQARKLDVLGDLALPTHWNAHFQEQFDKQMARFRSRFDLANLQEEAQKELGYQMTRRLLVEHEPLPSVYGVSDFLFVSAYQSEADFQADFALSMLKVGQENQQTLKGARLSMLLEQKFAMPTRDADPDEALKQAVKFVRDNDDFKEKRQLIYAWQDEIVGHIAKNGMLPERAVEEMEDRLKAYNKCVRSGQWGVRTKFGYVLAEVAIEAAEWIEKPLSSSMKALVNLAKFVTHERQPEIKVKSGQNTVAAMFHDVHQLPAFRP